MILIVYHIEAYYSGRYNYISPKIALITWDTIHYECF